MKRPSWKKMAAIAAPTAVMLLVMRRAGMLERINSAQTAPDHADAALRTREYRGDLKAVANAAQSTLGRLRTYGRPWKIVARRADEGVITLDAEVPVFSFTDDLRVTLRRDNNEVLCDVRSSSRIGQGDFGENRRHIRQFLTSLDEKL